MYDASGHKLGTEYFTYKPSIQTPIVVQEGTIYQWKPNEFDQEGTAYIGNFEYKTSQGNTALTTLSCIYNDEGYVENLTSPNFYYYRKDHLGDNREVWLANTNTTVQRTQYYPSGLPWASNTGDNPGTQNRKYIGKEFIEMHGYDCSDLGARLDYNAIVRTPTQDPHAENNYSISPYAVCNNNPVNVIDPDGQDCIISIQRDNKTNEITGVPISAKVYITGDRAKGMDKQLNAEAKNTFKADGIVKFDVNYQYVNKAPDKLAAGENVLTFSNENSNNEGGQIDNAYMNNASNERHDGNRGTIYANGDSRSVMHETGHFLGLSDRYDMINDGWNPTYPETHPGFDSDLMNYSKNGGKLLDKIYYDQYITRAKSVDPDVKLIKSYREIGRDKNGWLLTNPKYEKGGKHAYNSAAQ